MKVYLLYTIDILPKVVGVYTTYELAEKNIVNFGDYIIETNTDIEPNDTLFIDNL